MNKSCPGCFTEIDARALRCPSCAQRQTDVAMHRDVPGRMVAGVSAAIAQHFNWDLTLMRVVLVLSVAFTGGLVFWLYAAAWMLMPFGPTDKAPFARLIDGIGSFFAPPKSGVEKVQL